MKLIAKTRADQVYDYLLKEIRQMNPGENRLPSEDDLAAQMGVSRATIREALKLLLRNGYIKTVHGKGTFGLPSVVNMKTRTNLGANFLKIIQDTFATGELYIDWQGFLPAHGPAAHLFEQPDVTVHASHWRYYADGAPVIYGDSQVLQTAFAEEPEAEPPVCDVPHFCARYLKDPLAYIAYDVKCCTNEEIAEWFHIAPDRPFIYWEERYFDLSDQMCGAGIYYFHPDKLSLSTTISIDKINSLF